MSKNKIQSLIQFALFTGILIFVNILGNFFYGQIDLTEEKRYTLTPSTVDLLENIEEVTYVKVLLEGEFPAGFKRLQKAVQETLEDFRSVSGYIEYEFVNPNMGTVEQRNQTRKGLAEQGIVPTNLRIKGVDETREVQIYPWAMVSRGERQILVNLLESEKLGVPNEVVLNNSVSLLEYKLANALQKIQYNRKPAIVILEGHGELIEEQTADLEKSLVSFYEVGRVNLDSTYHITSNIAMVIIARPTQPFSERDKFILDQYIMRGGKVMWLIDKLQVNLDSLWGKSEFLPLPQDLNLDDQLFRYGARIRDDLVLDLECTRIPLVTGQLGSGNQYDLFPWYYHPLVAPKSNHPIVKSLDRVNLKFPSSIDTIRTRTPVEKTVLLSSSRYSRIQTPPVRLNFEILRYKPDPEKFKKSFIPMAVLLEGTFSSLYENRVPPGMQQGLDQIGESYRAQSIPTKMMVVSDGDIIKNLYNPRTQSISELGFNQFEERAFANKDFIINSIEYMLDDQGVVEARSREVKLRMLDQVRAQSERLFWQVLNIGLPLLFLVGFGLLYGWWRKRKFA